MLSAVKRCFVSLRHTSRRREPEERSRILAERLRQVIAFDHLDVLVFKEDSKESEWHLLGRETDRLPAYTDRGDRKLAFVQYPVSNTQEVPSAFPRLTSFDATLVLSRPDALFARLRHP
jgi:hypothetical protein